MEILFSFLRAITVQVSIQHSWDKTKLGQLDTVAVQAIMDGGIPNLERVGAACLLRGCCMVAPDAGFWGTGWRAGVGVKKRLYMSSGGGEREKSSLPLQRQGRDI